MSENSKDRRLPRYHTTADTRNRMMKSRLKNCTLRRENAIKSKRLKQNSGSMASGIEMVMGTNATSCELDDKESFNLVSSDIQNIGAVFGSSFSSDMDILQATRRLREILCQPNPSVLAIIDTNIAHQLDIILQRYSSHVDIQVEAGWCLANLACGGHEATKAVLVAVPTLVRCLYSSEIDICEQAAWALGNIAGDSDTCRSVLLSHEALPAMIKCLVAIEVPLTNPNPSDGGAGGAGGAGGLVLNKFLNLSRVLTWAISNMARGETSARLFFEAGAIEPLLRYLQHTDTILVAEVAWVFTFLMAKEIDYVTILLRDHSLHSLLMKQASLCDFSIPHSVAFLRSLGNISSGPNEWVRYLMSDVSLIPLLCSVISNDTSHPTAVHDAVWIAGCLLSSGSENRRYILSSGLFPLIIDRVLKCDILDLQREAVLAIEHAIKDTSVLGISMSSPGPQRIDARSVSSHSGCSMVDLSSIESTVAVSSWSAGGASGGQLLKESEIQHILIKLMKCPDIDVITATTKILRNIALSNSTMMHQLIDIGYCDALDHMQYGSGNEELSCLATVISEQIDEKLEEENDDQDAITIEGATSGEDGMVQMGGLSASISMGLGAQEMSQAMGGSHGVLSFGGDETIHMGQGRGRGRGRGVVQPAWMQQSASVSHHSLDRTGDLSLSGSIHFHD
jgi:hypothetical protein